MRVVSNGMKVQILIPGMITICAVLVKEYMGCDYYYGDDQKCMIKCYTDAGLDFYGTKELTLEVLFNHSGSK